MGWAPVDKALLGATIAAMARRDRRRDEGDIHQTRRLARLRRFAAKHSPFYAEFHRGLDDAPLSALPVLTKAMMMERFDEIATDRAIKLADAESFAGKMGVRDLFRGRYNIVATSGTTGKRAVIPFSPREWRWVMASFPRITGWSGLDLRNVPGAMMTTRLPWHMSARCSAEADRLGVRGGRVSLDSSAPLDRIVAQLNGLQPAVLSGYASMIRLLADEQAAGRLRIAPRGIFCTSEVMTEEAQLEIEKAFSVAPGNLYAISEIGCIAGTCAHKNGLHVARDMCILEIVDAENRPVPAGTPGAKTLVTALNNRTLPLIRYEITDCLTASASPCPCGRPGLLLEHIGGRASDVLRLPDRNGTEIAIAPAQISAAFRGLPISGWQLLVGSDRMVVKLVDRRGPQTDDEAANRLRACFDAHGAVAPQISVQYVAELARGASGKLSLVTTLPPGTDQALPASPA
jgi:phenylacetate-coenzyme A ligase PaaK-like adenylate-forming protein